MVEQELRSTTGSIRFYGAILVPSAYMVQHTRLTVVDSKADRQPAR
jgi:hypothetical protein